MGIRLPDMSQKRFGKYYVHLHRLLEIDDDTGEVRTVDFSSYPAGSNDWMLIRHGKVQLGKAKVKKPLVRHLPISKETSQEVI